jgi:hypothetical protein
MARQSKTPIEKEVDQLFREQLHGRRGDSCMNPVTGGRFIFGMRGADSITAQKRNACRALVAREWHAEHSPTAPPLIVNGWDIEDARSGGGLPHLLAYFSRSLRRNDWSIAGHPPFEIFARGLLASTECPSILREDQDLVRRFPPQPIYSMEPGLLYARPTQSVRL